ncbi:MAG: tautomerase family protein [Chloroflexota bacterium]
MPIVKVTWFAGRDKEQKDQVAKAITEAMVKFAKTKPESTTIVFEDVQKENWAKAGVLASDW